jgi:hypothetical protein
VAGPAFVPPKWRKPAPLGYASAVQFTYNTRQFLWSGADVRNWWPELEAGSELEVLPGRQLILRHQRGCPYAGLSMPGAWARYRRDHRTEAAAPGSPEASSEPERPR